MKKTLSLDLGSASLGWAITTFQSQQESQPEAHGIITFESGMRKKDKGYFSPTKNRREARTARIRLQHRRRRKQTLLKLLLEHKPKMVPLEKAELAQWSSYSKGKARVFPESENFKKWLACDFTYAGGAVYQNPYELRVKGLETVLTPHEFGRALYHLGQRRGYKDIGEKDKETDKQKKKRDEASDSLLSFQAALDKHEFVSKALKYERLNKNEAFKSVRTRHQLIYRHECEDELKALCAKQNINIQKEAQDKYKDAFMRAVHKAIIWQRPLKSQKAAVGKCTLEPKRRRCPASHPVYEIFRTWHAISNFKYKTEAGARPLKPEWRKFLFKEVFFKHSANFQFKKVVEKLNKAFGLEYSYNYKDKHTLAGMPFCKGLYEAFKGQTQVQQKLLKAFTELDINDNNHEAKVIGRYSLSDLWHQLYFTLDAKRNTAKDEQSLLKFAQTKLRIPTVKGKNAFVELRSKLEIRYAKLSSYAMRRIISFLEVGYPYHHAVLLAHFPDCLTNWEANKRQVLDLFEESQVEFELQRACNRVLNSLVRQYHDGVDISPEKVVQATTTAHRNWQKESTITYDFEAFEELVQDEFERIFESPGRPSFQKTTPFQDLFLEKIRAADLEVDETKLWHHSDLDNPYGKADGVPDSEILQLPVAQTLSIRNPMFNKALAVLRRLINHLLRAELIDPQTQIVLEIPRGLLNDNNERRAIEEYQREREKKRNKYRKILEEGYFKGRAVTDTHLERYELWEEQKQRCLYTGKTISLQQLFSAEIEIDHTIPRTLFPDNTMMNRTVTFRYYNTDIKGNRLPTKCPRYKSEIEPRLKAWQDKRDDYKEKWEKCKKASPKESEEKKNDRIRDKHCHKMHYDYWKGKLERFTCTEVSDRWARRQLQDTQMISKYARYYLETVFHNVRLQKGETTALFRKIYGFGTKDRSTHLHHVEDAVILSLIPADPQALKTTLEQYYGYLEQEGHFPKPMHPHFKARKCVRYLAENTLVYHFKQDKILKQTKKNVRKNGKLEYLKDGKHKVKAGRTVRGKLFKGTFFANLAEGERIRGKWRVKRDKAGKPSHFFAVREAISKITLKNLKNIQDEQLREHIEKQLEDGDEQITDFKDRPIRHVRLKKGTDTGRLVKERFSYRSKHAHKNYYYASAGETPYALLLERPLATREVKRKFYPIPLGKIAQVYNRYGAFKIDLYIQTLSEEDQSVINTYTRRLFLKVGQKVIVLKSCSEQKYKTDSNFLNKRLYRIKELTKGMKIKLWYHLESRPPKAIEKQRKTDHKTVEPSVLSEDGQPIILLPYKNAILLYEGIDFEMAIDGSLTWL